MQAGHLLFADGDAEVAIDCFVRDISEHGAGIECDAEQLLPKHVTLEFEDKRFADAEIAWRLERRIGLRFQQHRRRSPRRRQLKAAQLVVNDTGSVIDCRLRDISDHGAGIECEGAQHVPSRVILRIGDEATYEAEVVWRTERRLGLQFILKETPDGLLETLAQHRNTLEAGAKGILQAQADIHGGRYSHLNHPAIAAQIEHVINSANALLKAVDGLQAACSQETGESLPPREEGSTGDDADQIVGTDGPEPAMPDHPDPADTDDPLN